MKTYKGYTARVQYDQEDHVLVGRVDNIRDVVTFYANDVGTLEREFHASVDEYIAFCKERGAEPDKPYPGKILFRCGGEVHKLIATAARQEGQSVNAWLLEAAQSRLAEATGSSVAANLAATILAGLPMVQSAHQPVKVQMTPRAKTISPSIRINPTGTGVPN